LSDSYLATNPASAVLFPDQFDQALVETVRHVDGIKDAEGRRGISMQVVTGEPEELAIQIDTFNDFNELRINQITPEQGAWPPDKKEILIERSYLYKLNVEIGDTITLESPEGSTYQLTISGLAHDINLPPAQFTDDVRGYINLKRWSGSATNQNSASCTLLLPKTD
jgi:putative ABC transport system permease protein